MHSRSLLASDRRRAGRRSPRLDWLVCRSEPVVVLEVEHEHGGSRGLHLGALTLLGASPGLVPDHVEHLIHLMILHADHDGGVATPKEAAGTGEAGRT